MFATHETLEYPLLSDLLSAEQLDKRGEIMAQSHNVDRRPDCERLLARLTRNENLLTSTHALLSENEFTKRALPPAGVWLLDNFFLIKEQIQLAREHLPKRYSLELPRLRGGNAAGLPRVYEIVHDLISHVDGNVDKTNIGIFISSYQRHTWLNLGELWAIPIMLRLALLEKMGSIAARIAANRLDRDIAYTWAERMLDTAGKDPKDIVLDIADMSRADISMSCAFVAEMVRKLQSHNPALSLVLTWIEQRLAQQGQTIERQVQLNSQQQTTNAIAIGNCISSLRTLTSIDWKKFVESNSRVEAILCGDRLYAAMDFATRDTYRHVVEKLARRNHTTEESVALQAIELSRNISGNPRMAHVGFFLIDRGLKALQGELAVGSKAKAPAPSTARGVSLVVYVGSTFFLTAVLTALTIVGIKSAGEISLWVVSILMFVGISQAAFSFVNWAATIFVHPHMLPRMDFSAGIPPENCTLITVPAMLVDERSVSVLLDKMEVCFLSNRSENLYFSLLTDFEDASSQNVPSDPILIDLARKGISHLNNTYSRNGCRPFLFFHRTREWNIHDRLWMGYERKRGKLKALNDFLRSCGSEDLLIEGDRAIALSVKYVITLDTDTDLPRDCARHLIETMAHPLNVPIYDSVKHRIVDGYAILQPRVVSSLPAIGASWYSRLFGSDSGIDPYTRAVSDIYQDLFAEGSFIGKGIYDVDAFAKVLTNRFPENRILSHDLLEGTYCRSGLVSDVQVVDAFPQRYSQDHARRYRWIRGDWQIAAWLGRRVPGVNKKHEISPLSLLSQWKLFDNLRRSLIPAGLLLLIVVSWLFVVPSWLGIAVVLGVFLLPGLPALAMKSVQRPIRYPLFTHVGSFVGSVGVHFFQAFFALAILPHEALSNLDAVVRTWWRIRISHRNLLEWRASGKATHARSTGIWAHFQLMAIAPLFALAVGALLFTGSSLLVWIMLGVWFGSPLLIWWMSRPLSPRTSNLSVNQRVFVRRVARKTWRYFETFAGAEDNWLPADNYQEEPREAVAHRTSPTNIGLMLLSNLGAYDLGYINAGQVIDKTRKSFGSMDSLTRFHGHFLNWYDTETLLPLYPNYVSTVDSGNLAGYLLTLRTGLLEMKDRNIFQQQFYGGLIATLEVIDELVPLRTPLGIKIRECVSSMIETIQTFQQSPAGLTETLDNIRRVLSIVGQLDAHNHEESGDELLWWLRAFEDQCIAAQDELLFLAPWIGTQVFLDLDPTLRSELDVNRSLREMALLDNSFRAQAEGSSDSPSMPVVTSPCAKADAEDNNLSRSLAQLLDSGSCSAQDRIATLEHLAAQCQHFSDQEYDFLYDTTRNLLSIGYDVAQRRRDDGWYDLLASECRLGSFVAIAQGKLPVEHWFRLGRLIAMHRGRAMLLSWGGSMFEYLMPGLIMPGYERTLLGQTCLSMVDRQIAYGRLRGVPWGISESAENSTDASLNYQYRSFGVPGTGFKRDLGTDLVIAPYASALALMIRPDKACANMQRLANDGYEGRYGFYEAIDFTPSRLSSENTPALIRSFMAHHQGMSFISMVNFLAGSPMPRRFESDPLFRTTTLLLQERIPRATPFLMRPSDLFITRETPVGEENAPRMFITPHTVMPEVHLLSNGRYHVMISNAGGGYSRWHDSAVTRWNEDPTLDNCGTFIYVNDVTAERQWSTAFQPTCIESNNYEAIFPQGRAEFRRRDGGIDTYTEIAVSPEDDIEYRRITLSNFTGKARTIELTSYAEVVLVKPAEDAAHPAFSNLFVQTEILKDRHAILCSRRPRSPEEVCPWLLHLFTVRGLDNCEISYETDRLSFTGRNQTTRNPRAMRKDGPLKGTAGSVLDPIVSIRCRVNLKAGETITVGFITGIAATREQAEGLIDKYQDRQLADRVFDLTVIQGKVLLQQLNTTEADAQLFSQLASSIIYASRHRRANPAILIKNTRGQSSLWAYSISGDLPIILLRIGDPRKIDLVAKLLQAHAYWRLKGLSVDLVIWNEERTSYRQIFNEEIIGLIAAGPEASLHDKAGGVFVCHPDQMSNEDQIVMQATARVVFTDAAGTLADQIQRSYTLDTITPNLPTIRDGKLLPNPQSFHQDNLLFFNGWGGFTQDGREYIIQIKPERPTPMPWVNVVANKTFGTVISQSGGYTWFENAHEFRLTPWYNDPVSDRSGEAVYLRDENSGRFWSAMPSPTPGAGEYLNRHGFGYSVFEFSQYGINSELWVYVDIDAPVKFWMLKVRNDSPSARRLSATGFLELVLGESRAKTQMHVSTSIDAQTGALLAINPFNTEFAGRVVFFEVNEIDRSISGDRAEFIGRNGSLANPAALHRGRLSGKVGVGLDPAAAIRTTFTLEPGQEKVVVFTLGAGRDIEDARSLIHRFRDLQQAYDARDRVWQFWTHTLGAVNIETPDPALNLIANGWLVYQTISSRLWARSGFYQSGGAFGFRDQLQDVMALTHTYPELIREHLLVCASRQFREGDVQHWWHPPMGRGVRTMISDDYLWLPFVTCDYVMHSGDIGVLDEPVCFLESRCLNPDEESFYDLPARALEKATLYDHCKRAIVHAFRFGTHGLPLMGSGDWNDGMNLVGVQGKGESVWLAFFLFSVLKKIIPLAHLRGDAEFEDICERESKRLSTAINSQTWDGEWYQRAYFDDGSILGSSQNQECKIDTTVQCWSVLSGAGTPERSHQAMESLGRLLVDSDNNLIRLLAPPFDKSAQEPGYIKGYVPGVRENGGQYTHAAIWAVMAFAKLGQSQRVEELLQMINPINHGSTREKIERYLVEPYVMAADIYGSEPHTGRGGWTWYTGSASWMYRLIIESVLGLHLEVNRLTFKPCIPPQWDYFKIHYRFKETVYHLAFHQVTPGGALRVVIDGVQQPEAQVTLTDDQIEHLVEVEIK